MAVASAPAQMQTRSLRAGEVELTASIVRGQHPHAVLLWLPSAHGLQEGQQRIAAALLAYGLETWLVDPFAAWMLPTSEEGLLALSIEGLAQAIEAAAAQAPTPLILVSHDRGSVPLLEALQHWQRAHPGDPRVRGALLMTPNLFLSTPVPGQAAHLTSAARSTNLPLFLIQAELSPTTPRLPELLAELRHSRVYWRGVVGVRDRFFFRADASDNERAQAERLPAWIAQGVQRLLAEPIPAAPIPAEAASPPQRMTPSRSRGLMELDERPRPPSLALPGLDGQVYDLAALRGKVVLVNFWASWCPPCVHEMPSMQTLWTRLHERGLVILAVNLGESASSISEFVARHRLSFPILLDPARETAKAWRIYAYPTSFLIDRRGHIRFAIAGGLDWSETEVGALLHTLLEEHDD